MRNWRNSFIISPLALALWAGPQLACPGPEPEPEPSVEVGTLIQSDLQRDLNPQVNSADLDQQVAGNTDFALAMYKVLVQGNDADLFFSPHSISLALAMTYAGARADTATEMATALHFELPGERLHPAFNLLDLELMSRGENAIASDGEAFRLKIANSIWGEQSLGFEPDFLDSLALNYGAGLRAVDFVGQPEPTRLEINDWVAAQTEDRIKDLLPEGSISDITRLVLTNAIYFNAAWAEPFAVQDTTSESFNLLGGGQTQVEMMHQTEFFAYFADSDVEVIGLPYDGYELSMYILMPGEGQFSSFESTLDAARLSSLINATQDTNLELGLPKWGLAGDSISLKAALGQLGMNKAFGDADFSAITSDEPLHIGNVLHKAFVKVDEAGTEAAAATEVTLDGVVMPDDPIVVSVDRPFIYLIQDHATGQVLFVGRALNPQVQ